MPYNLNKCINYRTNKHLKVTSLRDINQDYLFHAMFYKRDLKKNQHQIVTGINTNLIQLFSFLTPLLIRLKNIQF